MKRAVRWLFWMFCILIASGGASGAFGMGSCAGGLTRVELGSEPVLLEFEPTANGMYEVCLFPEGDDVFAEAELLLDGEVIAAGSGSMGVLSSRLTAGSRYALRLQGRGCGLVEIAREALSRCFDMPLELADGEGYSKLIAREGDVHWYAISAVRPGAAIVAGVPEQRGLSLQAWLFDADGRLLMQSEQLTSGACVMSAAFESGERYYVRIAGAGTGKYSLVSMRSAVEGVPESVRLNVEALHIEGSGRGRLLAETLPAGACPLVFFDVSDREVAVVRPDGTVEGRSPGTAEVTAYAYGGARQVCSVSVAQVPVQGLSLEVQTLTLSVGDEVRLGARVLPENASDRKILFTAEDARVAEVDSQGRLKAVSAGCTRVTASARDGGFSAEVIVTVEKAQPQLRALLIGEQNYASTVESVRPGSSNSVQSIEKLLNTAQLDGRAYSVRTLMDAPRDSVIAAIRETFADAAEDDLSLIYITCHGFYRAGMSFFLMADGSVLSALDLERELRAIPGDVLLMADCCGSGGLLARAGSADDFLRGVTSVFQGPVGGSGAHGSKISVLASALLDQDSYRISFSDDSERGMATVFARALCDAMGWSIDRDARSSMNADADYDGKITLDELAGYVSRRVMWYLNLAGDYVQTVNVYPEGDSLVLFARDA